MLTQFELVAGKPQPFGASVDQHGCNFSIYCPDADEVFLCLFDPITEQAGQQFKLTQRMQSTWFAYVKGVQPGQLYGYRVRSKKHALVAPEMSIGKLLIDPYAKLLNKPLNWDEQAYLQADNHAFMPKAVVVAPSARYAPSEPTIKSEQRVIYEAHVKGLSQLHPQVPEHLRGTYLGASCPAVIEHIKSLGVTSVQFMPFNAFMPEPFVTNKGLTNYWGYNPINFFSPEARYAYEDPLSEAKTMIARYREAGLEVILDVVFNHTAESGLGGPTLSFKGLCHKHAYHFIDNDEHDTPIYANYSGCGNTLNVADPYIRTLCIDAMRYWVAEMGVSGFRFDLATTLARQPVDFKHDATFFDIVLQDPILKHAVLIAEPWDIGPGGYQLGQYPDTWMEVNDKYRDCVRGFWRADKGLKAEFATRFMGSRDIFHKGLRPMHASVNNVSYHDGYTLHDIVTYADKHNQANLEDNRDGHNHNLSANYGVEGPTDDPTILAIREQQKRNLFATLALSQGTPHVLAGDELSKTQLGNNNAYCQDNHLNWLHWQLDARQQQFLDYCCYVLQLRKTYPNLSNMLFADDSFDNRVNIESANWYRVDGSHKKEFDWVNDNHHHFAVHFRVEAEMQEAGQPLEWLYCVNSNTAEVEFNLPVLAEQEHWCCLLDTAMQNVEEYARQRVVSLFTVPSRSMRLYARFEQDN